MSDRIGGTFAPTIDIDKLKAYSKLAKDADGPVGDAMVALMGVCDEWLKEQAKQPKRASGTPHPSGRGRVVSLGLKEGEPLWNKVPWDHELAAVQQLFDGIPARDKALRDAAFHLLWYAKELALDRVPMTLDQL